jgi:hypothetical protein
MPSEEMVKKYYFDKSQMLYIPLFCENNMWDRTETLTPNTSIKCITPIGAMSNSLTVDQICMLRAQELASVANIQNKKLHVFWSGGLDSTTVLLCLMELLPKDGLVVMYTKASLEEYPGFFEARVKDSFASYEFSMACLWGAVEHACNNGIAVTGELADQMFGSVMFMGKSVSELQAPWESFDDGLCKLEKVHNFVQACPTQVNNVAEFLWWFNYATKYQNVQMRMLVDNTVSKLNNNIFHFFDTPEFNSYTVSTPMEVKIPGFSTDNYKKPLRDVIYALSKDADYAYTKPKVRSLVPIYGKYSRKRIAKTIDLNWERSYA